VGAGRPGQDHASWNQVNPAWPDAPLKLFGAGADSGTFDYFTEAVVGKAKSSRGDFTASEDDNVLVQGVSQDANALGYFGYAYYAENTAKLKAVPIVNPKGKAVLPSMDNVINGSYEPLSRPIFIYVSAKSYEKPEVKEFVEFYMKHGAKLSQGSEVRAAAGRRPTPATGPPEEGQAGHGLRRHRRGRHHHRRADEARSQALIK
jgi:ABC-type phosphate transport system substrate-binding protein